MIERFIILCGILFGTLSIPSLFRNPSPKIWVPLYILNCVINYCFDITLVKTNKVRYPVRLFPKFTKINIVYDFFVCPFLSVWFCQSTYQSKTLAIIGKLFLFSVPQGFYEILLERKTKTLHFKENWKWCYSIFLVFVVKLLSKGMLAILKKAFPTTQKCLNT